MVGPGAAGVSCDDEGSIDSIGPRVSECILVTVCQLRAANLTRCGISGIPTVLDIAID